MKALLRDPRKRNWVIGAGVLLAAAIVVTVVLVYSHGGGSSSYGY